jgi:AraC-like DNA-binding protein
MTNDDADVLIEGTRMLKLSSEIFRRLTAIVRDVLDLGLDDFRTPMPDVWMRELEEYFATVLIAGLTGGVGPEPGRLAKENRVKYVTLAKAYIEANLNSPLGMETLARVTDVSPRTLEYAFREVFDTTPLRYIKVRRLHAARRQMNGANEEAVNVTQVAMQYGFRHLSYFSRDYRAMFGEYPSETLAKKRRSRSCW